MAISRFKTSTLAQGLPKYQDVWDGISAVFDSDYELITKTTVSAGGSSTITFSSIPSTYKHLQLRVFSQTNRNQYATDTVWMRFNGDTANNYAYHFISGDGSSPASGASTSGSRAYLGEMGTTRVGFFGAAVVDILDYASVNKNKTIRTLGGADSNGVVDGYGGNIGLNSSLWMSTSSITSILIYPNVGTLFSQNSSFALYGIKGI